MKPEETVDFHIRWAWARLSKTYHAVASRHGASMPVAYALLSIDKDGILSTQLGPKMGMEPTGMSRLIRSMEEQGFIRRTGDRQDRRKVWIHLTPKGKKYRDLAREHVVELNHYLRRRIPKEKMKTFLEVIALVNGLLEDPKLFD